MLEVEIGGIGTDSQKFPNENDSDVELLIEVRSGDQTAFHTLIHRITPLVRARAMQFSAKSNGKIQQDDLTQEGFFGVLNAITVYKIGSKTSFRTFAYICATNRMISVMRRNAAEPELFPLFESSDSCEMGSVDPEELIIGAEQADILLQLLLARATEFEKSVLQAYLSGKRYEEIANDLSVSAKAVDNALQRVRVKLQKEIDLQPN
jgi:RNA polymerase sporulation-specific sigma factor